MNLKLLHEPHEYHTEGTKCIYQDLIKIGCTIREIIFHIVNDPQYLDLNKYDESDQLKYDHMRHYIYCIRHGFRHNLKSWKDISADLLIDDKYYSSLKEMHNDEIANHLKEFPITIKGQTIVDGLHRSMCMIGRIIKGQRYIPFYFKGHCSVRFRRKRIPNLGYRRNQNKYRLKKILPHIEKDCFKAIDVGSNYGYFSLNLANTFPNAQIFSVEGSYGTGNKESKGINEQTIIKNRLFLYNIFIYDTLFKGELIREFNERGIVFDYQISFSIFHWIVYLSYGNDGNASDIEEMLLSHLKMAEVTFIELPCVSQQTSLSPFYKSYKSTDEMFSALSQKQALKFEKLGVC
ncbi:MAG TPA: hypothetical protein P5196_00005, partial [Syntrophales bacterium]|nr:hypothetical protein [Syntrophales bacterium]